MNEIVNYLGGVLALGGFLLTILFWSLFILTPFAKRPQEAVRAAMPFTSWIFISPGIMGVGVALIMANAVINGALKL